jgi:hypothetical protein
MTVLSHQAVSLSKIWNMLRQSSYLDDLLLLTNRDNGFKDHLLMLEMVLARLSTSGMRVNISKSRFFAEQIECLGYWIIRQCIQPIRKKVEAIFNIKAPKTRNDEPTTPINWYSQLLSRHIAVADALSLLDIDSRKIQEEEVLTLLSGSENNSISNIEFPIHIALIFKEQAQTRD